VKNLKDKKKEVKNPKDKKVHGKKEVALSAKGKDCQLAEGVVGSHGPMLVISGSDVMCVTNMRDMCLIR
jgi:hypothetical protein